METAESNENRNKKSKIGFYVEYDWDFNLTHEIVYFLQQIVNEFEEGLIPYYQTRASYLLQETERQSEYVDDFPKNDRLCRMKDVAPEMYEWIKNFLHHAGITANNGVADECRLHGDVREAIALLARIDGKEEK